MLDRAALLRWFWAEQRALLREETLADFDAWFLERYALEAA